MNIADLFKKEEKAVDPFTANRNKKVMAKILTPNIEEQKQEAAEQGL